jgi:hypothetical protein
VVADTLVSIAPCKRSAHQSSKLTYSPVFLGLTNDAVHFVVTRSHKLNDRDHAGLADGTAAQEEHLPRYFAKHGPVDADPKKTKKDGAGKGNWYVLHKSPFQSVPLS